MGAVVEGRQFFRIGSELYELINGSIGSTRNIQEKTKPFVVTANETRPVACDIDMFYCMNNIGVILVKKAVFCT